MGSGHRCGVAIPRIGGVAVPEYVSAKSRRRSLTRVALWGFLLLSGCATSVHDVEEVLPDPAGASNGEVSPMHRGGHAFAARHLSRLTEM